MFYNFCIFYVLIKESFIAKNTLLVALKLSKPVFMLSVFYRLKLCVPNSLFD